MSQEMAIKYESEVIRLLRFFFKNIMIRIGSNLESRIAIFNIIIIEKQVSKVQMWHVTIEIPLEILMTAIFKP